MQDELRKQVKLLKALQGISYTEIAEHLEIHRNSLYNWLNSQFSLSADKESRLLEIIGCLKD
jgi:transposase